MIKSDQTDNFNYNSFFDDLEGYVIYELDLNGTIISWNNKASEIKGYSEKEVLGQHLDIFFADAEIKKKIHTQLLKEVRTKGKASIEGWRIKKGGKRFWAKSILKLKQNSLGEPIGIFCITRDLTDDLAIKNANERGRIFVEQSAHSAVMFDTEMRYLAVSNKFLEDYSLEKEEVMGKSHYEVFPEISDEWKQIHKECLNGATRYNLGEKFERADGSVHWLRWEVKPWYRTNGDIGGLLMYTEDISKKKKLEEENTINTQQFRGAFENSPIGMALVSLKGNWMDVNKQLCQTLGYTEDELLKLTFQDITHPEDLEKDLSLLEQTLEGKIDTYQMEKRYIHRNGKIIWAMLSVSLVRNEEGAPLHFVSMVDDITETFKSREALINLNTELNAILNSTHVSIISTDTEGIITEFNKGAQELLGYTPEEMVGKQTPEKIHLPEEMEARGQFIQDSYGKKLEGFDIFIEKAKRGEVDSDEWTYIKKDGTTFKVQLVITAMKNDDGEITGFIGVATDITSLIESKKHLEKSKRELEILAQRLTKQNNQLLDFAHITSHNLRSPVSNLHALVDIYQSAEDEQTKIEVFMHLKQTVKNLSQTLDQLMTSLKVQKDAITDLQDIQLDKTVDKIIASVSNEIKKTGAIITKDFSAFDTLAYNQIYMESILQNLITNALKYHSPERTPEILIKTDIVDGKKILSIKDNGLGIDLKRHGHKIFGLYKTFHRKKDARGVGLFITKTQVEAMGGKINVKSNNDNGLTFYIELN